MYGLGPSTLIVTDPPSPPRAAPNKDSRTKLTPMENHEKVHPRILIGRQPSWSQLYDNAPSWSARLWSVHLLGELSSIVSLLTADHIEQTFPLQAVVALTPRNKVLHVWEAHIGAFDITLPALLEGKSWLLPQVARRWWSEDYTAQLAKLFPREDIVFLLQRAEEVVKALKAGEKELREVNEHLFWLLVSVFVPNELTAGGAYAQHMLVSGQHAWGCLCHVLLLDQSSPP